MLKHIRYLSIGLCLVSSMQIYASPARPQSVKELIKLSELENVLSTSLEEMQPTLDSEAENILLRVLGKQELTTIQEHLAVLELSQLLKETSSKIFARPETLQNIEKIYAESLSEEEIQAYLKFLKTPEGKSINQKTLKINNNVFQYMSNLGQQTLSDPKQNAQLKEQFLTILKPLVQQDD